MLPSTISLGLKDQTIFEKSQIAICPGEEHSDNPDEPLYVSNGLHQTKPKIQPNSRTALPADL
jgi:hypothetical protein